MQNFLLQMFYKNIYRNILILFLSILSIYFRFNFDEYNEYLNIVNEFQEPNPTPEHRLYSQFLSLIYHSGLFSDFSIFLFFIVIAHVCTFLSFHDKNEYIISLLIYIPFSNFYKTLLPTEIVIICIYLFLIKKNILASLIGIFFHRSFYYLAILSSIKNKFLFLIIPIIITEYFIGSLYHNGFAYLYLLSAEGNLKFLKDVDILVINILFIICCSFFIWLYNNFMFFLFLILLIISLYFVYYSSYTYDVRYFYYLVIFSLLFVLGVIDFHFFITSLIFLFCIIIIGPRAEKLVSIYHLVLPKYILNFFIYKFEIK